MKHTNGYRCWSVVISGRPATGYAAQHSNSVTLHIRCSEMPDKQTILHVFRETPSLEGFQFGAIEEIKHVWVPPCIDLEENE